jgi:hypothetical protein
MSVTGVVLALFALVGVAVGLQSGIRAGEGPPSVSGPTDGHIATRRHQKEKRRQLI